MRYILRICGISFSNNFKKFEDAGIISYISEKGDDFDYFKKLLNVTDYWGGVYRLDSYNRILEQRYCLGFLLNNHSDEFLVDERHADLWLTDEIRQNINSSNDWFNFFIQYRGKGCKIYQTYIGNIRRSNLGVEVKKR